jgi:hypothetical protein
MTPSTLNKESVIPTDLHKEELQVHVNLSSNPYEEVFFPGYSQCEETREAIEAEVLTLGLKYCSISFNSYGTLACDINYEMILLYASLRPV